MITANTFFNRVRYPGCPRTGSWEAYRQIVIVPILMQLKVYEQGYDIESPPIKAYVNHGRWVIKCECGGAEKAWEEGWFMCQSCFNAKHRHQYRLSIFPKARSEIEAILELRPIPNRNWYPGEALLQLQIENEAHEAELLEVR